MKHLISADAKAREAESKARDMENKYGQGGSKEQRVSLSRPINCFKDKTH